MISALDLPRTNAGRRLNESDGCPRDCDGSGWVSASGYTGPSMLVQLVVQHATKLLRLMVDLETVMMMMEATRIIIIIILVAMVVVMAMAMEITIHLHLHLQFLQHHLLQITQGLATATIHHHLVMALTLKTKMMMMKMKTEPTPTTTLHYLTVSIYRISIIMMSAAWYVECSGCAVFLTICMVR